MTLAVRNWPVITRPNELALTSGGRYLMDGCIGEGILWLQLENGRCIFACYLYWHRSEVLILDLYIVRCFMVLWCYVVWNCATPPRAGAETKLHENAQLRSLTTKFPVGDAAIYLRFLNLCYNPTMSLALVTSIFSLPISKFWRAAVRRGRVKRL